MMLSFVQLMIWATVLLALLFSAMMDFKYRIIPNEFVILIAFCGFLLILLTNPAGIWMSILAGLLTLLGLGFIAHFDVIGGGDAKLIAATTLLVPLERIWALLAAIVITGGLIGCIYLAARYAFKRNRVAQNATGGDFVTSNGRSGEIFRKERRRIVEGEPMPYALAVFAGVLSIIISEPPQCFSAMLFWL